MARCSYTMDTVQRVASSDDDAKAFAGMRVKPISRTFDLPKPLDIPECFAPPSMAGMWQVGPNKPPPETWVRDFVTDTRKTIMPLPKMLFDAAPRIDLIHRVVNWQRAAMRAGTAKTKHRGEVRGSTRKIAPQKGRGRARHGDIKAPIFIGGGTVFGPKPKDWSYNLPAAVIRKALRAALTIKYVQGNVEVMDSMALDTSSTRLITDIKLDRGWKSALMLDTTHNHNLAHATRNVPSMCYERPEYLNILDIMKFEKLVITPTMIDYIVTEFHKHNDDPHTPLMPSNAYTDGGEETGLPGMRHKQSKVNPHTWFYRMGAQRRSRTGDFYFKSR